MRSRTFLHVSLAILALAAAYHLGASRATAQPPPAGAAPGRFAVIMGGPEEFNGAVLLDTATGETWGWSFVAWVDPQGKKSEIWHWNGPRIRGTPEAIDAAERIRDAQGEPRGTDR